MIKVARVNGRWSELRKCVLAETYMMVVVVGGGEGEEGEVN